MHPMHPIIPVPHLPTSHPTVPSRVLLHVRLIPRNSQLWLHHHRAWWVHHSRVTLVWRDRVCGGHHGAQHRNATTAPALRRVYSVRLLRNGAIRHRRRGSTVHHRIRNHLAWEWGWDGTHHRSRSLTRWRRSLLHRYPHWLLMHIWRSVIVGHHPTRNWTALCIHRRPWNGGVTCQRRRIRGPVTRTAVLLLRSHKVVLSLRWGGHRRRQMGS